MSAALPADSKDAEAASPDTIGQSGTAVLDLLLTLDDADAAPVSGPDEYIRLGDNLIPGWTLSLLGLTLLLAPLLAAADTWLREFRVDWRTRRSAFWVIERAVPPVAALVMLYLLALVGLVPAPDFPYDPARFPAGSEGPVAFAVLAAAFALAALLIRPMRTPLDIEPHTLAAAAGLLTGFALLGIWLLNPFLALLLAPAAHVWLLPARASGPPRTILVAAVAVLSLAGAIAAYMTVMAQLDLSASGTLESPPDDRRWPDRSGYVHALVRADRRPYRVHRGGRIGRSDAPLDYRCAHSWSGFSRRAGIARRDPLDAASPVMDRGHRAGHPSDLIKGPGGRVDETSRGKDSSVPHYRARFHAST